jgi:beta-glucosidase
MGQERYRDASLSLDSRVEDLISRMTLDEKVAQLGCAPISAFMDENGFSIKGAQEVAPSGIGEVAMVCGDTGLRPSEGAATMNQLQRYMTEGTRLGIPVLGHEEGTGGFLARDASVFPQALALAATFDPGLAEEVASVIREQLLAVGARHCLAPVLDVARDPRWGRVEETFGEDPTLCAVMGTAYARGLQSTAPETGVLATGKHFVGHGLPEGGRNHAPVHLGARELREVYAEPFAAAINLADLGSVMNSYSSVDGLAPAGAPGILTDLLRGELGFTGIVVSDYFALSLLITHHHVAASKKEAAVKALSAGVNVELPKTDCFGEPLLAAIGSGEVEVAAVEMAVRRVLRAKFALGLFERPFVDEARAAAVFETPTQRRLANRAAAESIVLLKNDDVLPIHTSVRKIALVGPGGDDQRLLQGDYHYPAYHQEIIEALEKDGLAETWNGADGFELLPVRGGKWQPGPYFTRHITPLMGMRAVARVGCQINFAKGCEVSGSDADGIIEAVRLAEDSDVAIVVVAGRSGMSRSSTVGETRDATCLRLTGVQEELIKAVATTGTPTVVVVLSGRVHDLSLVEPCAAALVLAFPLGEEGGAALADVLFGIIDPSGRLPVSLPRNVGQAPIYFGHRSGGSTTMFYGAYVDSPTNPLYAFGHGLSYTKFSYGGLDVDATNTASPVTVGADITNVGDRQGTEVVQLYGRDVVSSVVRPERQLLGFARVPLEPGQTRRVTFKVHPGLLALFDQSMRRVTEPGEFTFGVGPSSQELRATKTVTLVGKVVDYPLRALRLTEAAFSE